MRNWYCLLLVVFMVSCKSKAALVDTKPIVASPVAQDENKVTSEKIIQSHYSNKSDFSTLYIRANAKYKDDKQSQSISAEIKIKKNEKILISVRFLGITMAKALITPDKVQYYEKINGKYFEGDYKMLSEWLGTDLDYNKIQNLLIGKPIDDLTKGNFALSLVDELYKLNAVDNKVEKSFFFDGKSFLLKKQEINQPEKDRGFEVNYPDYQEFTLAFLPENLLINAVQKKGKTEISIEYNTVTFNEELSFPYSVPEGYDRIFIN